MKNPLLFCVALMTAGCAAKPYMSEVIHEPRRGGTVSFPNWSTGQQKTEHMAYKMMADHCGGNDFKIISEAASTHTDGYMVNHQLNMVTPIQGSSTHIRFLCED